MSQRGLTVSELLERLREQKRGKGRLPPAPQRSNIGQSTAVAYPATGNVGGIDSPLTETADSRVYHTTLHTLVSSSGFFVLEYCAVDKVTMTDRSGREVIFNYQDVEP